MTERDFYFCYDKHIAKYLRYDKGIEFITMAKHTKTDKVFYLFARTPKLDKALAERQAG